MKKITALDNGTPSGIGMAELTLICSVKSNAGDTFTKEEIEKENILHRSLELEQTDCIYVKQLS